MKCDCEIINSCGRCVSRGEDGLQLENVHSLQHGALLENIIFMCIIALDGWQRDRREGQIMCLKL